jgi:hypothetical protein
METFKPLFERLLPDLAMAGAALGVFIVLGGVVLLSIIWENSFHAWRRRPVHLETRLLQLSGWPRAASARSSG